MEGNSAPGTPSTPTQSTPSQSSPGLEGGNSRNAPSQSSPLTNAKEGAAAPSKPAAPEYYDVKVKGKVVKMTRQEVLDHASMAAHANERFNEAKQLEGRFSKFQESVKNTPIQALLDPALGLTKDQIRNAVEDWYHKEYIEPETLTEDQRRIREYESKLKTFEEEKALRQKELQHQEETRLTNQQREVLQNQIVEAMESSGLPKTKFFASRMAFYMRQNIVNGWEAPIEMIVKAVKNERSQIMSDLSEGASAEQLISMFGDGIINKIRQHDLQQLRAKRNLPPSTASSTNRAGTGVVQEKLSAGDVNRRLRDIRMGK